MESNGILDHKYFKLLQMIEQEYEYAKWKLKKDLNDKELKEGHKGSYDNTILRDTGALECIMHLRNRTRSI